MLAPVASLVEILHAARKRKAIQAADPLVCSSCGLPRDEAGVLTPIQFAGGRPTPRAMMLPLGPVIGYLCPWCLGDARRVLAGKDGAQ